MSPAARAHLQIHFCVLLWGFTAIFGKLITLPALPLVWWRMILASGALLLAPRVWRGVRAMPRVLLASYAGIGAIVALHWLTFYASIKLANASVGATCIALAPVFLAVIEPLIAGRRFDAREVVLGAAVVPGVALVVGGIPPGMRVGVGVGALSALLVAIFGSLNKRLVGRGDPLAVTFVELGTGALVLTLLSSLRRGDTPAFVLPGPRDAALLTALALVCTVLPFALSLVALRHISTFAAQLAVNLEPVYAVLLATALLSEHRELTSGFYAGVALILGAVLAYPLLIARRPAT
jgi:drug/metabolite transporter (DMT)-like permease